MSFDTGLISTGWGIRLLSVSHCFPSPWGVGHDNGNGNSDGDCKGKDSGGGDGHGDGDDHGKGIWRW